MNCMLTLRQADRETCIPCSQGETILSVLLRHGTALTADCGGNGTCQACGVQLLQGKADGTPLLSGEYLACQTRIIENITISFAVAAAEMWVLGITKSPDAPSLDKAYGIAIDAGTTTIAMALVGMESGTVYHTYTAENSQQRFGADVISRIHAANTGHLAVLSQLLRRDITTGIDTLQSHERIASTVMVSANTTLLHLINGTSCETLGGYPFTPVFTEMQKTHNLFSRQETACLFPSISAFVGGDIVSGLYALNFLSWDNCRMLIDLGTNGEMVIGTKHRALCCSVAAGPAFEGGNLSCGTPSVAGAIAEVRLVDDTPSFAVRKVGEEAFTTGDSEAKGLCGSGALTAVHALLVSGLLDESGALAEHLDGAVTICTGKNSRVVLTQKDIREIQLAKSAVRAGIETLAEAYGVTMEAIDAVYLSGGFGAMLPLDSGIAIGLFPQELHSKLIPAGNTSLSGAVKALHSAAAEQELMEIQNRCTELPLVSLPNFTARYVTHMPFLTI